MSDGSDKIVPIRIFETLEQAYGCLRWWKIKLFLTDWTIKLKFVPVGEEPLNNEKSGNVETCYEQKAAIITLPSPDMDFFNLCDDTIAKVGHEQTLVHELLHLKEDPVHFTDEDDYPVQCYNIWKHADIEMMARTLLMLKYDLPPLYFSNINILKGSERYGVWNRNKETKNTKETEEE